MGDERRRWRKATLRRAKRPRVVGSGTVMVKLVPVASSGPVTAPGPVAGTRSMDSLGKAEIGPVVPSSSVREASLKVREPKFPRREPTISAIHSPEERGTTSAEVWTVVKDAPVVRLERDNSN